MAQVVGAYRITFISDAVMQLLHNGLSDLGWLTSIPNKRKDVELLPRAIETGEEITPNKVAFTMEDMSDSQYEVGSMMTEDRHVCYVDVYAESEAIGRRLTADISALLRGKYASLGYSSPHLEVKDLRDQSTAFYVDIDNVFVERQRSGEKTFQKFWWALSFEIIDTYYDDLT